MVQADPLASRKAKASGKSKGKGDKGDSSDAVGLYSQVTLIVALTGALFGFRSALL